MLSTIVAIGFGGALGAVSRYGFDVAATRVFGHGFPWGTLGVNVLGSFLMGLLIAIFASVWQPSENIRFFLITGFLGAFTTFSAFSLDVSVLWERGAYLFTAGYIVASVSLSIIALFAAMAFVRNVWL